MELSTQEQSYDDISDNVRRHCALRLSELLSGLLPYVDGSMGDVMASHAAVYVTAVKELGRLYRAQERPAVRPDDIEPMLPVSQVEELVARTAAAVAAETELRVRELLAVEAAAVLQVSVDDARDRVRGQLLRVRG